MNKKVQSSTKATEDVKDAVVYDLQEKVHRLEFELSQYKITQTSLNSTKDYRFNEKIKHLEFEKNILKKGMSRYLLTIADMKKQTKHTSNTKKLYDTIDLLNNTIKELHSTIKTHDYTINVLNDALILTLSLFTCSASTEI